MFILLYHDYENSVHNFSIIFSCLVLEKIRQKKMGVTFCKCFYTSLIIFFYFHMFKENLSLLLNLCTCVLMIITFFLIVYILKKRSLVHAC